MAHGLSLSLARTAQKAPRRTAGCFLILLCKQAANQARRHADAVQQRHDKQILFGVFVGAQQHRQPHACARAQPRHHASQRKLARGIQLGDEDRGHTVGNEPHKPGQHRLPRAAGRQECTYALLAHQSHPKQC